MQETPYFKESLPVGVISRYNRQFLANPIANFFFYRASGISVGENSELLFTF